MDPVIVQAIRGDIASNDISRQSSAILVALQLAAGGKDISCLASIFASELIGSSANAVSKQLAYDAIRTTHLTPEDWEVVCRGMANDLTSADPDVSAAAVGFLPAVPGWRIERFLTDQFKEISNCLVRDHPPLRRAAVDALGVLLSRADVAALCAESATLLDKASLWWRQIAQSALDNADEVSSASFLAMGRLFTEFSSGRLNQLAGSNLGPLSAASSPSSLSTASHFVMALCGFIWGRRGLLMARSSLLPLDHFRASVFPLAFAARAVATGLVDELRAVVDPSSASSSLSSSSFSSASVSSGRRDDVSILAGETKSKDSEQKGKKKGEKGGKEEQRRESQPATPEDKDLVNAERTLGVSDIVTHLSPYLSSFDPALVFEVAQHLLSLAGVPGGKPEWTAAPITAFLALWDRQEFSAGREAIVKAVVSNLQQLDLQLQVALFKRLLVMVRNLRAEADRMHALACICRSLLCVDLFVKENARRGQRPLPGSDVPSLFDNRDIKEEFAAVVPPPSAVTAVAATESSGGLFREELLACLIESSFHAALVAGGGAAGAAAGAGGDYDSGFRAWGGSGGRPGFSPGGGGGADGWAGRTMFGGSGKIAPGGLGGGAGPGGGGALLASLAGQSSSGFASWALSALDVVEVCRSCVRWDCAGRSYAIDCYLRLLVRLCQVYDTVHGVRTVKEGATPEQVQAEMRLQALQRKLLEDLKDATSMMPHVRLRLLWALAEHMCFSGPEPLFPDEPRDPLTMLVSAMHRLLFNPPSGAAAAADLRAAAFAREEAMRAKDPKVARNAAAAAAAAESAAAAAAAAAASHNRLQEVQAILVCALHVGVRSFRAAALVAREVEQFRTSPGAESVVRHHCTRILQALSYVHEFPDRRWAAWVAATGEYPFSHHGLSVLYNETAQAQDRKLEGLVKRAVGRLWQSGGEGGLGEMGAAVAAAGGGGVGGDGGGDGGVAGGMRDPFSAAMSAFSAVPAAVSLSGSSDLVHVEASHWSEVAQRQVTLHIKVLNVTEIPLTRVDLQLGVTGGLRFPDSAPRVVRELRGLQPQEPAHAEMTVQVTGFQRCVLQLYVVYHQTLPHRSSSRRLHLPTAAMPAIDDDADDGGGAGPGEGSGSGSGGGRGSGGGGGGGSSEPRSSGGIPRLTRRRSSKDTGGGGGGSVVVVGGGSGVEEVAGLLPALQPVRLRCLPYRLPLTRLLLPYRLSPVEFFRIVPSLPFTAEHTGAYLYETSGERSSSRALSSSDDVGVRRLLAGLRAIDQRPLHKVCSHLLRSRAGFQVCYMARTWFGDVLSVVVFGTSDIASDGGFGVESTTMFCRFVIRSSSQHVVDEIVAEPQEWLDDLTGGAIRAVTEEELVAYAALKKKRHEEGLELLKQSMKAKEESTSEGIPLPGMMNWRRTIEGAEELAELQPEEEVPVIPEEEHALQLAVLQEWSALREQQKLEME